MPTDCDDEVARERITSVREVLARYVEESGKRHDRWEKQLERHDSSLNEHEATIAEFAASTRQIRLAIDRARKAIWAVVMAIVLAIASQVGKSVYERWMHGPPPAPTATWAGDRMGMDEVPKPAPPVHQRDGGVER